MVQVNMVPTCRDDLKEIYDDIYLDATEIAKKYVRKIVIKTQKLHEFPQTGGSAICRSFRNGTLWAALELILDSFAGDPTLDVQAISISCIITMIPVQNKILESDIYMCYKK